MKAIVCDKCGKVNLLEDDMLFAFAPVGMYRLIDEKGNVPFELCKECGDEMLAYVRMVRGGG
jgi:ferredoxin-like protein FixX